MEISYILLIITCFFYGATQYIKHWEEFAGKLINVLVLIALIVLTIITGEDGGFISSFSNLFWLNYIFPAGAIIIGTWIGEAILDQNDDWGGVFVVLAGLGIIATIITTCCGI